MKSSIYFKFFILMCLSLISSNAISQSSDLFEISLEELLNIRVNIASKREQSIEDAPGIITVIKHNEFKRYGAKNLHDVMRLIPGFQQIYPQFTHRSAVSIRGQAAGALDKYFLILLNGKPLRDPILYGVNAPVYEGIPLELIDRLEIIKGPGSVVYGSNAFSGVMDIITKNNTDNIINITQGSFNTHINEFMLSKNINEFSVTGALRLHDSQGWKLDFIDTGNNDAAFKNKNHSWGGFLELQYQDLTFNFFKAQTEEIATLSSGLISEAITRPSDRSFYALNYNFYLGENWLINTSLSTNYSTVAASTRYDAKDIVFTTSAQAEFSNIDYDFGLNLHKNALTDAQGIEVSDVLYKSLFAQVSMPLTNEWDLTTGIQIVDPQKSDIQIAPRISLIGHFNENYHTKLIYGRAYSSPTGVEFSLDLPGLFSGNKNLTPTMIDNYDFQFEYKVKSFTSLINLFYSDVKDSIGLVSVSDSQPLPKQFQNLMNQEHKGVELETKYHHNEYIELIASYSYQTSENDENKQEMNLLSNYMIRTGISYNKNNFNLSLFNVYHSKVNNRDPVINPYNPAEKSYSFLTFNLNYEMKHLLGNNKHLNFNFYIDNALNNDAIFLPDPTLSNLNTMPKIAERAYYLSVKLTF